MSERTGETIGSNVYRRLRELVLERFAPGEPLSEPELAKLLGVSRTPVRESLGRLERDGLVRIVPRKGAFVSTLGITEIHELFEVREAIETYEIRQVAKKVSVRALRSIEMRMVRIYASSNEKTSPSEKFEKLLGVFDELHDLILQTRGNRRFVDILGTISGAWHLSRKRLIKSITSEGVRESYQEHLKIIHALKQQDPVASERAMRTHIVNSRGRYINIYRT